MKKSNVFVLASLLTLTLAVPVVQHLGGSAADAGSNYKIKGQVQAQSGGYRHVVIRTRAEQDEFIPYGYCRNN